MLDYVVNVATAQLPLMKREHWMEAAEDGCPLSPLAESHLPATMPPQPPLPAQPASHLPTGHPLASCTWLHLAAVKLKWPRAALGTSHQ